MENKPVRCIDPVLKCCSSCIYGYVHYPEWVETYEDLSFCSIEVGCIYGFEDDEPTEQELADFEKNFSNR